MEWRLFATLAETAGTDSLEMTLDGEVTLRDAFEALLDAHPELEADVLDDDGDLHDHVRLLVDGRSPFTRAEGWDTPIDADTELALFPPVSGG